MFLNQKIKIFYNIIFLSSFLLLDFNLNVRISHAQAIDESGTFSSRSPSASRNGRWTRDGESAYQLGCLAHAIEGHYFNGTTRACGELPYNEDVNRMIDERTRQERLRSDMNGRGVLLPEPEFVDELQ